MEPVEYERKCAENAAAIEISLRQLRLFLDNKQYQDFWNTVRQTNVLFKERKPLDAKSRGSLWQSFQSLCARANEERDVRKRESSQARERIRRQIEDLRNRAVPWFFRARVDHAFWESVRKISTTLKSAPLLREDRDWLWGHLNQLCEEAKRVLGKGAADSGEKRDWLLRRLREVNLVKWATTREAVDESKAELYEVLEAMKRGPGERFVRLLRDDHDACWSAWQEAKGAVDLAYSRFREQGKRNHDDWVSRKEGHIERWLENIDKAEDVIRRLQGQIDHCNDLIANAATSDFADMVSGWIAEKEDKIRDIEASIRELQDKIYSARQDLRGR